MEFDIYLDFAIHILLSQLEYVTNAKNFDNSIIAASSSFEFQWSSTTSSPDKARRSVNKNQGESQCINMHFASDKQSLTTNKKSATNFISNKKSAKNFIFLLIQKRNSKSLFI